MGKCFSFSRPAELEFFTKGKNILVYMRKNIICHSGDYITPEPIPEIIPEPESEPETGNTTGSGILEGVGNLISDGLSGLRDRIDGGSWGGRTEPETPSEEIETPTEPEIPSEPIDTPVVTNVEAVPTYEYDEVSFTLVNRTNIQDVIRENFDDYFAYGEEFNTATLKKKLLSESNNYLKDTDYVVLKIAEGVASREEYADVLAKRAECRTNISDIRSSISSKLLFPWK